MRADGKKERKEWQHFTRGAEIWLHQMRMATVSYFMVGGFSLGVVLMIVYAGASAWVSDSEGYYTQRYFAASVKEFFWRDKATVSMIFEHGERTVPAAVVKQITAPYRERVVWKLWILLIVGLGAGSAAFFALTWFLTEYGTEKMEDDHLRGAKLTDSESLKELIKERNQDSPFAIAGVPMIRNTESYHVGITGAQGSGKTQSLLAMLAQIRGRGEKAAIFDPTGQFIEAFYRPDRDVILNPLDARSPCWTIWNEVRDLFDYMSLAEDLIPTPDGNADPFWTLAGRQVFEDTCRKLGESGERSNSSLYTKLAMSDLDGVYKLLAGSAGAQYVSPTVEKTGQSLRLVVVNALRSFSLLSDSGERFSIRNWMEDESNDGWLFISSREPQKTALTPLISLWVGVLIRFAMGLPEVYGRRRFWLFLDELAGLQKMDNLVTGLTNLRKYGVPVVVGFQVVAHLFDIYGENMAKTILSQLQTKLLLRVDGDGAKILTAMVGEAEIDEKQETYSYGIDAQRDGMSVFSRRNKRDVIFSSDVAFLDNMNGYLILPGAFPVAKVKFEYVPRAKVAEGFVQRDGFKVVFSDPAGSDIDKSQAERGEWPDGVSVDMETGEILMGARPTLLPEQPEPPAEEKVATDKPRRKKRKPKEVDAPVESGDEAGVACADSVSDIDVLGGL